MKNIHFMKFIPCTTALVWRGMLTCFFYFFLTGMTVIMGQDTTDTTSEAEEEVEMIRSRMSLTANQYSDGTIELIGLLRARIDGSFQKVAGEEIAFYFLNGEGEEVDFGKVKTGADGMATLPVDKTDLFSGDDGSYSFIARFEGNDKMDGSESDLMLKPARLTVEPIEEDSSYALKIQAIAESPDGPQPIAEATVSVYIKRMFSSLKIGEGETDEEGMVEIDFPEGLPGDENGHLEISVLIEETEEYGNLKATLGKKWGTSVSYDIQKLPRALWSPHPPAWMIISFFILMGTVWIHYMIIVINLYRIKSEKPEPIVKKT